MRYSVAGAIAFFLLCSSPAGFAQAPRGVGGSVNGATVWVPDYYGGYVLINTFASDGALTTREIPLSAMSCNPNAVAVRTGLLYIVCNSDFGGIDQILVYDVTSLAYLKTITGTDANGADYFIGSSLTGILFDAKGNLWTTGDGSNTLLRVPKSNLDMADPQIDREVIDSPDLPAGMALDSDKSIWIVGQYVGGIVLNFTNAVLNQPGSFLKGNPLDPTPRYCISNSLSGCQQKSGLFDNPEGVASFHGSIWVSNNGGNAPAATIVRLNVRNGQIDSSTYGGNLNEPFACPGGVFSATGPTGTQTLWVNDEGRDVANTDCGSSGKDQSATAGLVMEFLYPGLKGTHQAAPVNDKFSNWKKLTTSSPGFGGIFVQLN
jgi:hypothetical protein